jgi:hypothetical protein
MKAAISSLEVRDAGNSVEFEVDELNYNPEASRVITKVNTLDGTVITTNWGYPEGNVIITLSNILLSRTDYDKVIAMKADNDYDFLFCYKSSTWKIIIQSASGVQSDGDRVLATLTLSVIEKYTDMETS